MTELTLIKKEDATYKGEDGDHERLSHYVPKAQLESAILNGTPCLALCGKIWVPTRDAVKFPTCPECAEVYQAMRDE